MSQTLSLSRNEGVALHQSLCQTAGEEIYLQDSCTVAFVESLKPDAGLRAFARRPEREHQLLRTIAGNPESMLTLAYTAEGLIVGQVTLAPADSYWQGLTNVYEIAVEVSAGWRSRGIARQLLNRVFKLDSLEDRIIIGMGLSWHWDIEGLGLTSFAYRDMIERLFSHYSFVEYLTSEENIRMDPANIFLARIGCRSSSASISQFYNRLLQSSTLPGM
jgi:GNAT superfamily N-acetyltransferase